MCAIPLLLITDRVYFAPLLRWVLRWWSSDEQRLALAMDASNLGQRFTVLAVSVVYRGCAIPVAWAIVSGSKKEPGNRIGCAC